MITPALVPGETHVGPGYAVGAFISAGPIPNDDYVQMLVKETATGNFLVAGFYVTNGFLAGLCCLGGLQIPNRLLQGIQYFLVAGGAVSLDANQYHKNGTFVQSGTLAGLVWDPTGGAWAISGNALNAVKSIF